MTLQEFSDEMDVIYENINKGGAVGLDDYEKSVILTMAAEKLGIELIKADLASVPQLVTNYAAAAATSAALMDSRAVVFALPDNYVSILNESVNDATTTFVVLPLMPIEYQRLMSKPYKYPTKRSSWRLVNAAASASEQNVEIIGPNGKTLTNYKATITILPTPIIVGDSALPDGLTVRGLSGPSETNLSTALHPTITEYATTLAERYYFDKYGNPAAGQ